MRKQERRQRRGREGREGEGEIKIIVWMSRISKMVRQNGDCNALYIYQHLTRKFKLFKKLYIY